MKTERTRSVIAEDGDSPRRAVFDDNRQVRPVVTDNVADRQRERVGTNVLEIELLVPMFLFAGGIVYFGVNAELSAGVAGEAARTLLGVGP